MTLLKKIVFCFFIYLISFSVVAGRTHDLLLNSCSRRNDEKIKVIKILKAEFELVGQQLTDGKISNEQARNKWAQLFDYYSDHEFQLQKEFNDANRGNGSSEALELVNLEMKIKQSAVLKTLPLIIKTTASDIRINRIFVEQCEAIVRSSDK